MTSLRARLLAWTLGGAVLALAAAGTAGYVEARAQVNALFDAQMAALATRLSSEPWHAAHEQYEESNESEAHEAREAHDADEENYEFVLQAWDARGAPLFASSLPRARAAGFSRLRYHGDDYRVYRLSRGAREVQVAQRERDRRLLGARLALRNLLPFAALVPLLALAVWVGTRRGLAPLTRLSRAVAARAPGDPSPIEGVPASRELAPLVQSLNALIVRLNDALARQREFVADAAHALRTPLAALGVQIALLRSSSDAGEREQALARLERGLARASRLATQLLDLARLGPEVPVTPARVDLTAFVRESIGDHATAAELRGVDLGAERLEPAVVDGDVRALRLLVDNLIDNAIKYTPPGGRVDVGVQRSGRAVTLEVRDTGPGIAPEERARVFERFYRGRDAGAEGSGLGLAIVRRVAERHGAEVRLGPGRDGRGLTVSVEFKTKTES